MKKGFTLVEMLIVIVIIGLIVGILVGIMGNPLREATLTRHVAKIADDFRSMADATDLHYVNTVTFPAAITDLVGQEGGLKMAPVAPQAAGVGDYAMVATATEFGGAGNDLTVEVDVPADFCARVMEDYEGVASPDTSFVKPLVGTLDTQCVIEDNAGTMEYTLVKVLAIDIN